MFGAQQPKAFGGGFGQTSGFGQTGFGAAAPATTGFGAPAQGGFGQTATPTTGFGQAQPTTGFGGFGQQPQAAPAGTGMFGGTQPAASPFGASRPAFGAAPATTGFGAPAATGGFGATTGGFGSTATPAASGFGGGGFRAAGTTGAFGQSTSGFGQTAQPATGGFGQTSTFGATSQPGFGAAQPGFGAASTGGFGSATTGTGNPPYRHESFLDGSVNLQQTAITAMPAYAGKSFEELRFEDYQAGKTQKSATASGFGASSGGFGAPAAQPSTGFGGFGQSAAAPATSGFGQPASTGFGQPAATGFGQPAATGFGQTATTGFGQTSASPFRTSTLSTGFGAAAAPATGGGLFGSSTGTGAFGQAKPAFGAAQPAASPFGAAASTTANNPFGKTALPASTGFGAPAATGFGAPAATGFGAPAATPFGQASTGFGATNTAAKPAGFGGFGTTSTSTPAFGAAAPTSSTPFGTLGQPALGSTAQPATGGLFGKPATTTGTFGQPAVGGFGGFGQTTQQTQAKPAAFGSTLGGGGLFQNTAPQAGALGSTGFGTGFGLGAAANAQAQPQQPVTKLQPYSPLGSLKDLIETARAKAAQPQAPQSGQGQFAAQASSNKDSGPTKPRTSNALTPMFVFTPPTVKAPAKVHQPMTSSKPRRTLLNLNLRPMRETPAPQAISDGEVGRKSPSSLPFVVPSAPVAYQDPYFTFSSSDYYSEPSIEELMAMPVEKAKSVPHFLVGSKTYGTVEFNFRVDVTSFKALHFNKKLDHIVVFSKHSLDVYPDEATKPERGKGLNGSANIILKNCYPSNAVNGETFSEAVRRKHIRCLQRNTLKIGALYLGFDWSNGDYLLQVRHFTRYGLLDGFDESDDEAMPVQPASLRVSPAPCETNQPSPISPNPTRLVFDPDTLSMEESDSSEYLYESTEESSEEGEGETVVANQTKGWVEVTSAKDNLMEEDEAWPERTPTLIHTPAEEAEPATNDVVVPGGNTDDRLQAMGLLAARLSERVYAFKDLDRYDDPDHEALTSFPVKTRPEAQPLALLSTPVVVPKQVALPIGLQCSAVLPVDQVLETANSHLVGQTLPKEGATRHYSLGRSFRVGWGPGGKLVCPFVARAADPKCRSPFDNLVSVMKVLPPPIISVKSPLLRKVCGERCNKECNHASPSGRLCCAICGVQTHNEISPRDPLSGIVLAYCDSCKAKNIKCMKDMLECRWKLAPGLKDENGLQLTPQGASELVETLQATYREKGHEDGGETSQFQYHQQLWELVGALYLINTTGPTDCPEYLRQRREVSRWLKHAVEWSARRAVSLQSDGDLVECLTLLSGGLVEEAVQLCLSPTGETRQGDYRLAMILSQSGGSLPVQAQLREQMRTWVHQGFHNSINPDRWLVYQIAAGVTSHGDELDRCTVYGEDKGEYCSLYKGLDWRRAMGVLLWYGAGPHASLDDCMELYKHSMQTACVAPDPPYQESNRSAAKQNGGPIRPRGRGMAPIDDTTYSLLDMGKLTNATAPHVATCVEDYIHPSGYVQSWVEKLMGASSLPAWLLCDVVGVLSSNGSSDRRAWEKYQRMVVRLASELEEAGLWTWAVWVLRHLDCGNNLTGAWRSAIFEIVVRNYISDAVATGPDHEGLAAQRKEHRAQLREFLHDYDEVYYKHAVALSLLYQGKHSEAVLAIASVKQYGYFPMTATPGGTGVPSLCNTLVMDNYSHEIVEAIIQRDRDGPDSRVPVHKTLDRLIGPGVAPALQMLQEQLSDNWTVDCVSLKELAATRPYPSLDERYIWAMLAAKKQPHQLPPG
eukprot:Ihof_evm1s380 gene=Ihof_evmTU1s380